MAGIDNGRANGLTAQVKQFGSILLGNGPPVPEAGVVGDLYLDVQTWQLFAKRGAYDGVDPWGHYLFVVPLAYRNTLKWFSASYPQNSVGVVGDYCLAWAGFANYGLQPSMYGPKVASGWPENGEGPGAQIDALYGGYALPVGLSDEGTPIAYSNSSQILVAGLTSEYLLAIPVPNAGGTPVLQEGLQSNAFNVEVVLNPLYAAQDQHPV